MTRFWITLLPLLLLSIPQSYQTLVREDKTVLENIDTTTINVPLFGEVSSDPVAEFESDFKKIGLPDIENTKDKSSFGTKKTEFLSKKNEKKHVPNKGKRPSPYLIELDSTGSFKTSADDLVNATIVENVPLSLNESQDLLQTSESRQRSKIEIKEVNGTLYEYEYIYYYDDDYPLYDYDTPSITGDSNTTVGSKRSKKKDEGGISAAGHKSEKELQSVANNEILTQRFGEARHLDNIAAENNVELLQAEGGILPAQTRFPPRSTTPPSEVTTDQNLNSFLLDANDNVLPNERRQKLEMPVEKAAIDLYAFSKLEEKNFEESSTKTSDYDFTTESPNYFDSFYEYDITASDLEDLGLLTTSDTDRAADFITTAKDLLPTEEPSTTTSTTTTTTSTTTTTTTTTTEAPTTSSTRPFRGRNRPPLPGRGFPRQRGITSNDIATDQSKEPAKTESDSSTPTTFNGRRRFNRPGLGERKPFKDETKAAEPEVSSNTEIETEAPVKETPSLQTRGRLNRRKPPTLRNRINLKAATEATIENKEKQIEEATETVSKAPRLPLRSPATRQRRPLGRNRITNRFSPKTSPSGDADTVDTTATDQNESVGAVSEIAPTNPEVAVEEPKEQSLTTTEKSGRPNIRRNHRFNIDNRKRFRSRKEDRLPKTKTEDTASETAQEPIKEEESLAVASPQGESISHVEPKTEEEPTESANPLQRGSLRRRNNRKNLNRLNHRFKNKQETSENSEPQNGAPISPTASEDPLAESTADQQAEDQAAGQSPSQSGVTDQVPKFSRTLSKENPRKNRIQNRRRQKPTLLPSVVASSQTEAAPDAHEGNIEEPPVEPVVNPVTTEVEQTEQSPSPDHPVEENVTEGIEPETTTEKLTRRQELAKRRNRFIHNG